MPLFQVIVLELGEPGEVVSCATGPTLAEPEAKLENLSTKFDTSQTGLNNPANPEPMPSPILAIDVPADPNDPKVSDIAPAVCEAWAGLVKALTRNIMPTPAAKSGSILDKITILI